MELELGKQLVLDELFDLTLYKRLRNTASEDMKPMFDELIPTESKHFAFWQDFFSTKIEKLNFRRRLKLEALVFVTRILGNLGVHLVLEAIEVYGVRKYINVWNLYKGTPMGDAVHKILEDEFKHEDEIVTSSIERRIHPERVRDIFLGLNDGLVEILGAVSGFFAALSNISAVMAASFAVAVAGAISMAAGAFGAVNSEKEVEMIESAKKEFLKEDGEADAGNSSNAFESAVIVGISYFFGALVPMLPIILGARNIFWPLGIAMVVMVFISTVIAFLSGMKMSKRIVTNLVILLIAVGVTYVVGILVRSIFGMNI
ncbi:MAG TPA: VIT1/CCC1 transporter family protein [Candidatus Acidoferrales bacterium]|nr:VIT1/CCC1 transporter family protein [Candidatus Acidoferrales bacterium]